MRWQPRNQLMLVILPIGSFIKAYHCMHLPLGAGIVFPVVRTSVSPATSRSVWSAIANFSDRTPVRASAWPFVCPLCWFSEFLWNFYCKTRHILVFPTILRTHGRFCFKFEMRLFPCHLITGFNLAFPSWFPWYWLIMSQACKSGYTLVLNQMEQEVNVGGNGDALPMPCLYFCLVFTDLPIIKFNNLT